MRRILLASRVAALMLLALCTNPAQADNPPEDARQALRDWRSAFVNVRIRYTVEFLSLDPEADYQSASYTTEWTWTEDSDCMTNTVRFTDEIANSRLFYGTSDTESFNASYKISPSGDEWLEELQFADVPEGPRSGGGVVMPLMGLWLMRPRHDWLPDLIEEMNLTYEGTVDVGGAECVEFSYLWGEENEYRDRLALDPAHGYLPRRLVYERTNPWTFVVTEYQQLPDGIWFPREGTMETGPSPTATRWLG